MSVFGVLTLFISGVVVSCTVSGRTVSTGCTMGVSVSELLLGSISGDECWTILLVVALMSGIL